MVSLEEQQLHQVILWQNVYAYQIGSALTFREQSKLQI
jgi:hypothetical protein